MISILLATTGRPDMAEATVEGIIATTAGRDIEVVTAVDADEETLGRFLRLDWQHVRWELTDSDELRGCSRAWNDALAASTGDPVVLAADDLYFEPGWLDAALAKLEEFPEGWGMVGFNDGHWGPELSTHYLMSRRFVIEVLGGVVAWDCYGHSFNDTETNERARRADRYAWAEDAHVRHAHWLFGDRDQDETDTRGLVRHAASQATFDRRSAEGFPDDQEAVIVK
jgi:GT2 family glycosyltransferase